MRRGSHFDTPAKSKYFCRYLYPTWDEELVLSSFDLYAKGVAFDLEVYIDSDWAGRPTRRTPITGGVVRNVVGPGPAEGIAAQRLLCEAGMKTAMHFSIHTGSASGTSMAGGIGTFETMSRVAMRS